MGGVVSCSHPRCTVENMCEVVSNKKNEDTRSGKRRRSKREKVSKELEQK
jgi:hypothetical protein